MPIWPFLPLLGGDFFGLLGRRRGPKNVSIKCPYLKCLLTTFLEIVYGGVVSANMRNCQGVLKCTWRLPSSNISVQKLCILLAIVTYFGLAKFIKCLSARGHIRTQWFLSVAVKNVSI